jgi:hypothetical protein
MIQIVLVCSLACVTHRLVPRGREECRFDDHEMNWKVLIRMFSLD